MLIDTHCHIQSIGLKVGERSTRELWAKAHELTIDGVVESAVKAGVSKMIAVGCEVDDSRLAVEVAEDRPEIMVSIGIHPHEAQRYVGKNDELSKFEALIANPKVIAIGECGLDFYYNHSPKQAQIEILNYQLKLAQKHNLPVIFHVRGAFDDFWPIFDQYVGVRGVLHSFTDSKENLAEATKRGLFIGVNGIATFAKSEEQLAMYKAIPSSNLLLETDAPFLTPVPYRGTICEPRHIVHTAEFLSIIRGESTKELADATTSNAKSLFGAAL